MKEPLPRWALGSWARIAHATVISFALVTHFLFAFLALAPLVGLDRDHFSDGSVKALAMTVLDGVWSWGVVIGLGLLLVGRERLTRLGWRLEPLGARWLLGPLGAVAMIAIPLGTLAVFGRLDVSGFIGTISSFTAGQRLQMLLIGFLAASTEETVFRGYLQPALMARAGFWGGLVLGALVFMAYHVPLSPHPLGLSMKFLFGLVLGLLRGRDGTLLLPALAHFLFWQVLGFA